MPLREIAFFGHDSTESTIIKRVTTFEANGSRVVGFMYRRQRGGDRPPSWQNIDLGLTIERNYLARLPRLFAGLLTILQHGSAIRACRILYARNIDMLLIAALTKLLTRSRAVLVYEVLDVQRVFLGQRLINRLFRWMERALLARCDLLVVSSPDFISHYFEPCQHYTGPWRLLENKISARQIPNSPRAVAAKLAPGPPWVIGWFGVLRCVRSLEILGKIADALGDRVQIHIRGVLSKDDLTADVVEKEVARRRNLTFGGPYVAPRDLSALYGAVHFTWCIDYLDAGTNSDWLLPNRLYEGGLMGSLALARKDTATGRMVERENLGWTFSDPLNHTVAAFLDNLDPETFDGAHRVVEAKSRSVFVDETDTRDLLEYLDELHRLGARHRPASERARTHDAAENSSS